MKKTIMIIAISVVCIGLSMNRANAQGSSQGTKVMSVEEANRLNGTVQPTYKGGKTYAQWVAEEKAKKAQADAQQSRNITSNGMQVQIGNDNNGSVSTQSLKDKHATNLPNNGGSLVDEKKTQTVEQPVTNDFKSGKSVEPVKTTEPVILKTTDPTVTNQRVNSLVTPPKPDMATLKTTQKPASQESRSAEEIQKAKILLEASKAKTKVVAEENAAKTQTNPLLIGVSIDVNDASKTAVKNEADKLKPVEGGANTPVKKD